MKTVKHFSLFSLLLILIISSCKKLDVGRNPNEPYFEDVFSSGEDLRTLTSGLFNTWYTGNHSYSSVGMMLATASDHVTCSWGNQGMRDMSWEPRNAWNNAPNYTYQGVTKYFFDKMYASISTSSNILKAVNGGVKVGVNGADDDMIKAFCKFNQGIAYGSLALVFDKAFIVDENISIDGADFSKANKYDTIALAAVKYLDEAIALCSNSFTIPKDWLGTTTDYSNTEFKKLCNSFAARILANYPRTKAELATINWGNIKTYADAGITADFVIQMDAYVKWYSEAEDYLTYPGWGKVDMYVVNLMDNTQPAHWGNTSIPAPPESTAPQDQRIFTDFEYSDLNWFQAARGYYHFSNYRYSRTDAAFALGDGPVSEFMKAENDMLRAEARAYTSDVAGAAVIINAGTRVTRGNMTPVAPVLADVEKAIHHERQVEMYVSGMGLAFFEMRKKNLLQKGTPLHWPLPAKTLEIFALPLPFYSFGGGAGDGINSSNVGWR